jgi:hypothetical protein
VQLGGPHAAEVAELEEDRQRGAARVGHIELDPTRSARSLARMDVSRAPLTPTRSARLFALGVGVLVWAEGHRLAYLLEGSHHDHAPGAHGYLPLLYIGGSLLALAGVLMFAAGVRHSWRRGAEQVRPLPLLALGGLIPGTAFVLVELAERSFGAAPPALVLFAGFAIQLVLGCLALVGSRRVLTTVRTALRRTRRPRPSPSRARRRRRAGVRPHAVLFRQGHPCRAPPTV